MKKNPNKFSKAVTGVEMGVNIIVKSPQEFTTQIQDEVASWDKVVVAREYN